jgi:hypothetical protein
LRNATAALIVLVVPLLRLLSTVGSEQNHSISGFEVDWVESKKAEGNRLGCSTQSEQNEGGLPLFWSERLGPWCGF